MFIKPPSMYALKMLVCFQMSMTEIASVFVLKPKCLKTQTQITCASFLQSNY